MKTMTPQQKKAKELVGKYLSLNMDGIDSVVIPMTVINAKQCATIAVNEMIEQNGELYLKGIAKDYYLKKNSELFEVKTEIKKL